MTAEEFNGRSPEAPPPHRRSRRKWLLAVTAVFLFGVVSAAGYAVSRGPEARESPEGWQVIRPPREVSALAEWRGFVWAGGADGLYAIDPAGGEPTPGAVASLEGAAHLRYISSLLVDRQGRLWVGHDAGVTVYAPQPPMNGGASGGETGPTLAGAQDTIPGLSYTVADGLPHSMVRCLAEDSTGRIWAGTYRGAAVIEDGRIAVVDSVGGLIGDAVRVILADSSGGLWFGATEAPRGGLSLLANGSWQYFTTENGMPHNNINALMEDDDGAVWVATGFYDRGGVARLVADRGGAVSGADAAGGKGHRHWVVAGTWDRTSGMPGAKARSLFQTADGCLWMGTEYDGVLRVPPREFKGGLPPAELGGRVFTQANGLAHNEVKVMLQDADGNLWLGTSDGLTRITASVLAQMTGNGVD